MLTNNMTHKDTSSSEEDLSRFEDSVSKEFSISAVPNKIVHDQQTVQSLRPKSDEELSHNPFNIKVTPGFQNHVAKYLSKVLDEQICFSTRNSKLSENTRDSKHGVKLLSSSRSYLTSTEYIDKKIKQKRPELKRRKLSEDSETERLSKAGEAAVSGEWVLSKKEIEHWAPVTKGEIIIVKSSKKKKKKKCKNDSKIKQ